MLMQRIKFVRFIMEIPVIPFENKKNPRNFHCAGFLSPSPLSGFFYDAPAYYPEFPVKKKSWFNDSLMPRSGRFRLYYRAACVCFLSASPIMKG